MKAILTAAWAAVLSISSLPAAAAQPDYGTRSVTVDYSDLDLTRAPGVSTLQHRVSGAVRQVCDAPAFGLHEKMQQRACLSAATASAKNDVDRAIASARQQNWAGPLGTAGGIERSSSTAAGQRTVSSLGGAGTATGGFGKSAGTGAASEGIGKSIMGSGQQPWSKHERIPQR